MIIAKVINTVVSTRKHESLQGVKLLIVETVSAQPSPPFVAGDLLGAGVGEYVLIAQGRPAQSAFCKEAPVDAMVVGILDQPPETSQKSAPKSAKG